MQQLIGLVILGGAALFVAIWAYIVWRNGYSQGWESARNRPPSCLACGYNLTGLTHTRCPECGSESTLEELWRTAVYVEPRARESSD